MILHSQSVYVSVAHRYWNPEWSEERNRDVYGRLASQDGVGSNLKLTLRMRQPEALKAELARLKALIDHHSLHLDIPEFERRPSTLEAIALHLAAQIQAPWEFLSVAEGESFSVTVRSGAAPEVWIEERALNLTLGLSVAVDASSALAVPRGKVWAAVRRVGPQFADRRSGENEDDWARRLALALSAEIPGLKDVKIDIGGQRFLRVQL